MAFVISNAARFKRKGRPNRCDILEPSNGNFAGSQEITALVAKLALLNEFKLSAVMNVGDENSVISYSGRRKYMYHEPQMPLVLSPGTYKRVSDINMARGFDKQSQVSS